MQLESISPAELQQRLERRQQAAVALLDVRERWEYSDGHIPDATPLPRGLLEIHAPAVLPDRSALVVCCSNEGTRASLAAATLRHMGHSSVRVLDGGLGGWRAAGLGVATGWGAPGKRIGELIAHADSSLQVPATRLATWLAEGRTLVIDVRPAWEHGQGHVPGALSIPASELPHFAPCIADLLATGRIDRVVTHCAGRTRGIAAADLLRHLGIARSFALENGCMGWLLNGGMLEFGIDAARVDQLSRTARTPGTARFPYTPAVLAAAELVSMLERGKRCYLLDVRSRADYLAGHIPGAISVPAGQLLLESEAVLAIAALPVIIVGSSETQASWVASHALALGYPNVAVLQGGMEAWRASGEMEERGLPPLHGPPPHSADAFETVTARELAAARDRWEILDVRSAGEWGVAHLEGSRCIPRGVLESALTSLRATSRPLLLVSATGLRARLAARDLAIALQGCRTVAVLERGLHAARGAGVPIVDDAPDSSIASRDTAGRITAATWKMPLEKTRPLMLHYLAWEEALAGRG